MFYKIDLYFNEDLFFYSIIVIGDSMSELNKMIRGQLYNPKDLKLIYLRDKATRLLYKYNHSCFHEYDMKNKWLKKLLNTKGNFWIKPPFYCDYGFNITIGKEVMINYNCTLLDVCPIIIGDYTLIGPNTGIYTATHPIDPKARLKKEFGKPITIGKHVWIGGSCVILPGVTIGDNSVIGAGSTVVHDIPSNVVAVGNPCKVIKEINNEKRSL